MISFLNSANVIQYIQLSINYKKCLFKTSIIYAVPKSVTLHKLLIMLTAEIKKTKLVL